MGLSQHKSLNATRVETSGEKIRLTWKTIGNAYCLARLVLQGASIMLCKVSTPCEIDLSHNWSDSFHHGGNLNHAIIEFRIKFSSNKIYYIFYPTDVFNFNFHYVINKFINTVQILLSIYVRYILIR